MVLALCASLAGLADAARAQAPIVVDDASGSDGGCTTSGPPGDQVIFCRDLRPGSGTAVNAPGADAKEIAVAPEPAPAPDAEAAPASPDNSAVATATDQVAPAWCSSVRPPKVRLRPPMVGFPSSRAQVPACEFRVPACGHRRPCVHRARSTLPAGAVTCDPLNTRSRFLARRRPSAAPAKPHPSLTPTLFELLFELPREMGDVRAEDRASAIAGWPRVEYVRIADSSMDATSTALRDRPAKQALPLTPTFEHLFELGVRTFVRTPSRSSACGGSRKCAALGDLTSAALRDR